MQILRKLLLRIVPAYGVLPLIMTLCANTIAYFGSRLVTQAWAHYDMTLPLDARIPCVPWTVSIYVAAFAFWAVNYILCVRLGRRQAYRLLSADLLAKCVCLLCFLLIPTAIMRPEITGTDLWSEALRALYRGDAADNLFPSIHCLASWFGYIGVRGEKRIPLGYRVFSCLMALAVCVSTVTTKQHVFVDIPAGVALAEASYFIAGRTRLAERYGRAFESVRLPG